MRKIISRPIKLPAGSGRLYFLSFLILLSAFILWVCGIYFDVGKEIFYTTSIFFLGSSAISFSISFLYEKRDHISKIYKNFFTKILIWITSPIISFYSLIETRKLLNKTFAIDPSYLGVTTSILTTIKIVYIYLTGLIILIIILIAVLEISEFLNCKKRESTFLKWARFTSLVFLLLLLLGAVMYIERIFYSGETIEELAVYCDFYEKHRCTNPELKNKPIIFLEDGFVLSKKDLDLLKFEILSRSSQYKKFEIKSCLLSSKL